MAKSILVINGPNINMLGTREPKLYGCETLRDLEKNLTDKAQTLGCKISFFQSNHEGQIVDTIQQAKGNIDFIIINAAAFTHTSVAIRDALLAVGIDFYEVHISNIHARDEFRHFSYLSDIAKGVIVGFGLKGYEYALDAACSIN